MESQEMERRLDRVETKIDGVVDRIGSIDNTLIKQSVILDEHIKRTEQLEGRVLPIETYIIKLHGITSLLKILTLLATIITALHLFKIL
jgi:hypothetical protein